MSTASMRLAVIAESDAVGSLMRELIATTMPGVEAQIMDPTATTLSLGHTACVLIDAVLGGEPGITVLRRIRAAGYSGAAVMLVGGAEDASGETSEAASLGARCVPRDAMARELGSAVADAIAAAGDEAAADHVRAAMRRTQRLVAAGEIALRMQHALNNPLSALLAEVQMLGMEPSLKPEHQEPMDRIVELTRRVIGLVRMLDGVGERPTDERGGQVQ